MLVNTYKEIIKTPAIMDKVAAKYPELGLPTDQLIKKVNISSVNDTQVITLTIEDNSYEKAVKTVNAISEVFKNEIPSIMKVDNVMILNEAQMVDKPSPVKPNKQLNLAISFVVSLMAAVGLAFLLEYLDDTIKTEADVYATLQLPVLVTIHQIKEEEFKNSKTSKQNSKVGETQYAASANDYRLITSENPRSFISEAYRTLRTNIQFSSIDEPIRSIVITSPEPSEGKSTTIVNLAAVFAQEGKKVLIVDADMRKPTLHNYFQKNRTGPAYPICWRISFR